MLKKNNIAYKKFMNSRIENAVDFIYKDRSLKTIIKAKLNKWDYNEYPYLDTLMFLDKENGTLSNVPTKNNYKLQLLNTESYVCQFCDGTLISKKTGLFRGYRFKKGAVCICTSGLVKIIGNEKLLKYIKN